ncbi:MAG: hypothetical protein KME06_03700 [Kastovskya adunca ATA6-11-RM4]|jgi:hypothetical protein|nr:hypothetical protein [Kastovskya adunca ATA6-11-RM4]
MTRNQQDRVGKLFPLLAQCFDDRYPQKIVTRALGLPMLMFGGVLIAASTPATAQTRLPTPPVIFDELPPATPATPLPSIPTLDSPPPVFPPSSPSSPTRNGDLIFQAPPPAPVTPTRSTNLYRVYVSGNSPSLLAQVQQFEPDAFVRSGEGVIQAGVFSDRDNAQLFARRLESQGLPTQVVAVGGATLSPDSPISRERGYFVVIPASTGELPGIAERALRLGLSRNVVNQRQQPRGPHVAVGPFEAREQADRWSNQLRSEGMDARVYFGR